MIFPFLWRVLPGNRLLKTIQLVILAAGIIIFLFEVAFPLLDNWFGQDPAVGITP